MVLVGEASGDRGRQSAHVWVRAFDRLGEVLYDELEVWKGFSKANTGMAIGSTKLKISSFTNLLFEF